MNTEKGWDEKQNKTKEEIIPLMKKRIADYQKKKLQEFSFH